MKNIFFAFLFFCFSFVGLCDVLEVQLEHEQANIQSSLAVLSSAQESSETDVDLSQVISLLTSLDSQMTNLRTAIGQTPTRSFGWLMGQMQSNLTAIKNATTSLLALSNLVDNISTETTVIRETLEGLYFYCDSIYTTLEDISVHLFEFYSAFGDFAVVNTNFLGNIVDALRDLCVQIGDITNIVVSGGVEGGGFDVSISGGVDVRNWPSDYTIVRPLPFGWSANLLTWLEDVTGRDELDPDYDFISLDTPITVQSDDYFSGVLELLVAENTALIQMQQSLARIVLELKSGSFDTAETENWARSVKSDWETVERNSEQSIANVGFRTKLNSFNDTINAKIDTIFGVGCSDCGQTPSLDVTDNSPIITITGGQILGFNFETFYWDFQDYFPSSLTRIIRAWMLFLYSAGIVFMVFRIVPWGTVKFAALMYYVMQINKKV